MAGGLFDGGFEADLDDVPVQVTPEANTAPTDVQAKKTPFAKEEPVPVVPAAEDEKPPVTKIPEPKERVTPFDLVGVEQTLDAPEAVTEEIKPMVLDAPKPPPKPKEMVLDFTSKPADKQAPTTATAAPVTQPAPPAGEQPKKADTPTKTPPKPVKPPVGKKDTGRVDLFGQPVLEDTSLVDRYIEPPFSVLNTRDGRWQDREKKWKRVIGNLSATRDGEFGKVSGGSGNGMFDGINDGTSNFSPVLCELIYHWFNLPGGKVLDPFGGEQTKGFVAGELKYPYRGCEIRQAQVDYNNFICQGFADIQYVCGDSNNLSKLIPDRDFDFCWSSPPYYDLEVYSAEDMSALGTYTEFMKQYQNIFQQCYDMLKPNRFLGVKVGEIRNKKTGAYRGFVRDNIDCMEACGFTYYNEIILVNAVGTAPQRANNTFKSRKIVKLHQNVLIFFKGDLSTIKGTYPDLT